jgi:hypothetical protein
LISCLIILLYYSQSRVCVLYFPTIRFRDYGLEITGVALSPFYISKQDDSEATGWFETFKIKPYDITLVPELDFIKIRLKKVVRVNAVTRAAEIYRLTRCMKSTLGLLKAEGFEVSSRMVKHYIQKTVTAPMMNESQSAIKEAGTMFTSRVWTTDYNDFAALMLILNMTYCQLSPDVLLPILVIDTTHQISKYNFKCFAVVGMTVNFTRLPLGVLISAIGEPAHIIKVST